MSERLRKLEVRLEFGPGEHELVGRLAELERTIYFEYDPTFLASRRSISPLHLPAEPGAVRAPAATSLHGVFADALPDGWGLVLMDRHFRKAGHNPEQLSSLERLAYLGARTMGALTFHPCTADRPAELRQVPLDLLAAEADKILEGQASELLPELLVAGGSPAGARPKVLVHVRGDALRYGAEVPPAGHTAWLIKFASRGDGRHAGAIEFVYSRLARRAGLEVPETRLFECATGQRFFGSRRFDRDCEQRAHVHTLAGVLNTDFRTPNLDYEKLLRVTTRLTRSPPEMVRAFRQMVFNVLAHNRDDHGKNFTFIMARDGTWRLSPAYDLTFAEGAGGEHLMSIAGEARRPTWSHMLQLARVAAISEKLAGQIVDEVREALRHWPEEAAAVELPRALVAERSARLSDVASAAQLPGTTAAKPRPPRTRAR